MAIGSNVELINNLDAGNPLYLQNNDNSSLAIVNIKLVGAENYKIWAMALKIALKGENKMGFIDDLYLKNYMCVKFILKLLQRPACTCDAKSGSTNHTQLIRLMQFLMGLNDVYQPIRSTILAKDPLPNVKDAFYVVSREESHRGLHPGSSSSSKIQPAAFIAKTNNANNFNRRVNERCYDIISYLVGFKRNPNLSRQTDNNNNKRFNANSEVNHFVPGTSGFISSSFTNEQMVKLLSLINEKPTKSITLGWFINSGANQHLTDFTKNMFNVVDVSSLMLAVGHPNGTLAKISAAIGSLLFDVLVVPEYNVSLLSVNKMIKDSFSKIDHQSPCDICHKVKQTREPFPLSDHKSKSVGDIVHCDVWGPYRVISKDGFKFFLTIVDDYSRAIWVYLLKSKTEVEGDTSTEDGNSRIASDDCSAVEDEVARDATHIEENVTFEGNIHVNQNGEGQSSPMGVSPELRRSTRPKVMPARFNDFVVNSSVRYGLEKYVCYNKLYKRNLCFSTTLNKTTEPKTFQEASQNAKWIEAMNLEMEARFRNNTYVLVDLPPGRKAIGCNCQREGIDYEETFSPVVKMVTVRCLIALFVQNSWPLYQLDVNNAFLYGDLKEDVYMELPPGHYDKDETRVCKLIKSLYGLKQAPRQWNEKLTTTLIEHGFVQSKNDYSLFIKDKNGVFIAILVYVDDIVVIGNNNSEIDKFKHFLSTKFMIKDLGQVKYFLGIGVLENINGLCLSQRKYCLELLNEYGLLACKPATTPLQQNVVLGYEESENDKFLPSMTKYQKIVGKLIYLSITRPDISYVVHCLSQHMHAPLQSHFSTALRVLRYLKGAPGTGIHKKQATISRSSAESEYRCLASTTCEIIWVVKVLKDLGVEGWLPVNLYCDSSSAISIAGNHVFHEKTKHFEIDLHLVRDKVADGVVKVLKVASASNVADIFTKGLSSMVLYLEGLKCNLALYKLVPSSHSFIQSIFNSSQSLLFSQLGFHLVFVWYYLCIDHLDLGRQGDLSVPDYYHKLNSLWREFDILTVLPACVCENRPACTCDAKSGSTNHTQLIRLMQFLMGLNDVYQPIRITILAKEPLPNVNDAFYVVSREESHRGLHHGSSSSTKIQPTAFIAKTNNANNFNMRVNGNNNNNANRGPNPNLLCKNCGLIGHTIERCYEIIGYPAGFKRNHNLSRQTGNNNNKRFNANSEVNHAVPGTSGSISSSFTNEQMVKLFSLINEKPTPAANMSVTLGWIIDFGANQHMTDSTNNMFNVVDISSLMLIVGHPNGTLAKITVIGSLRLTSGIVLFDVLVVPEYNDFETGHFTMKLMALADLAKQTREPFPLSDHKSKSVGDIVHCDVWGPYRVVSKDGFKFFLTIVMNKLELIGFILLSQKRSRGDTSIEDGNSKIASDDCSVVDDEVARDATHIEDNVTSEAIYLNMCFSTTLNKTTEPKTFQEAAQNPKWLEAMNLEMEALFRNNTYVLVDLPPGEGIDYEETFSLVVKMVTVRCLIALSVKNSWPLYQLDVNNAFLYGDLKEDVYMELPPGYYDKDETRVCKVVKSLYGLKQAPRQWNEKLTTALIEHDSMQSKNDYSLFIKDKNEVFIAILVYVDDIVVTGNNNSEIDKFKHFLSTKFMIKDLVVKILKDLGVEGLLPVNLYCDSSSAISIAGNPVFHEKTKHFEIDLHLVRDKVADGVVKVLKVASASNVADVFTKGLSSMVLYLEGLKCKLALYKLVPKLFFINSFNLSIPSLNFDVLSPVNKSPTRKNQGKKGMSSSRRHAKMRKTGGEGQEEEQEDSEGKAKRKPHVMCDLTVLNDPCGGSLLVETRMTRGVTSLARQDTGMFDTICTYQRNTRDITFALMRRDILGFYLCRFCMKDMGEADVIFGIRIKHESKGIYISPSHYIEKLEFYGVISFLMYVMTCTRHGITFVVEKLIRYTNNPITHHWQAVNGH
ncbi:ribonuclease H-like domain-containing protein [Tanacetum coccineum]